MDAQQAALRATPPEPQTTEEVVRHAIAEFTAEALRLFELPDRTHLIAALDFAARRASGRLIGYEPDTAGLALAEHTMHALMLHGELRLGIRTAFMWYCEQILDDHMIEAAELLRSALMGDPYGPATPLASLADTCGLIPIARPHAPD